MPKEDEIKAPSVEALRDTVRRLFNGTVDIVSCPALPPGMAMLVSPPPAGVVFKDEEEMLRWYAEHPKRVAIIEGLRKPEEPSR